MSDNLEEFFSAPDAPERDAAFRLAVAERMARRRLSLRLGIQFLIFILISAALATAWPVLEGVLQSIAPATISGVAVLCVTAAAAYGASWFARHLPLLRMRR